MKQVKSKVSMMEYNSDSAKVVLRMLKVVTLWCNTTYIRCIVLRMRESVALSVTIV